MQFIVQFANTYLCTAIDLWAQYSMKNFMFIHFVQMFLHMGY